MHAPFGQPLSACETNINSGSQQLSCSVGPDSTADGRAANKYRNKRERPRTLAKHRLKLISTIYCGPSSSTRCLPIESSEMYAKDAARDEDVCEKRPRVRIFGFDWHRERIKRPTSGRLRWPLIPKIVNTNLGILWTELDGCVQCFFFRIFSNKHYFCVKLNCIPFIFKLFSINNIIV